MKKVILISFSLLANFIWAGNTVFYDAINGKSLTFTYTSRVEELAIDEYNPVEETDYIFFTFLKEEYEKLRTEKLHERFKMRALEASFKQKADTLAKAYFEDMVIEGEYYRKPQYQGYVVEGISLQPISYLGNTLTFSFIADLNIPGIDDGELSIVEVYYLDLSDFSFLPASSIHQNLDYEALRKALVEKWEEIKNEMPRNNWDPVPRREVETEDNYGYIEIENVEKPEMIYADSLVSYAVQHADLKKAEIMFTGSGVLVVLNEAFPWFESGYKSPIHTQLHLNPYEAKEALRNFKPYEGLQNAMKPNPGKLAVDPFDLFMEANYVRLDQQYLNFLRIADSTLKALEKYVKNNPSDSQYIYMIKYENGRADQIKRRSVYGTPTFDSIFWKDDYVQAVISQRFRHNYGKSGNDTNLYLQVQARDEYGNTEWHLTTENGIYIHHFSYFDDMVGHYRYPVLSGSKHHVEPYWYEIEEDGLCIENGQCAKIDEHGRPAVSFRDYYAYDDGKLVQILGDRESSTLFNYDEEGRLTEVVKDGQSGEHLKYFYKDDELMPHLIEHGRIHQSQPQKVYFIFHR